MGDDVPSIRICSLDAAQAFWCRPRRVERCEASCRASKTCCEGPVTVRLINSTRWCLRKHRSQCLSSSHAQEVLVTPVTPSLSSAESCDKLRIGEFAISMCHCTGVARILFERGGTSRPTPPSPASVMHTFEAVAGSWGLAQRSRVMGGAPERNKNSKKI